ncbi:autotransporter domain-containing protein [Polynucleobacter sp. AP-Kolm-20A-A1]|uniref:beta strand repeat-containing protein n=1 Tax=Polynucleobacter sp. AP-Kolm-20A-A1 TaxID=2081041 RepID=UPI001BFD5CE5|nr:autotransporter domain-containing protein [Polynucleobacter sp. AP-Kolm-20A-A1]QWE21036.1 autotransporter domain-containing protein [Polynucleobacter sp. AP-Kolm-20A-A1]
MAFIFFIPSLSIAANGSCLVTAPTPVPVGANPYVPVNGQTVECSPGGAAATAGVISAPNTTTQGNGVNVLINATTQLTIDGSTVGLGSGAVVNNNGSLDTSSFYNGYGISAGANGRSQAGGNELNNNGSIVTKGGNAAGIYISATNATSIGNSILNAGSINTSGANAAGIRLNSGSKTGVNSIVNSGTISTAGASANGIDILGSAQVTVENTNTITASGANSFGIYNLGNLTTLNNSQGGSTPLTYSGVLPLNYNVIVTNPTTYGKLDASAGTVSGVMNFGIKSGSTLTSGTTYSTVLSGIKINNLGNSYGTFGAYQWALVHRVGASANQTDLVILNTPQPTLAALETVLAANSYLIAPIYYDTQTSLVSLGNTLQGLFAMQSAGVVNGMSYDCSLFGANNFCVSAGGRYTNVSTYPDNTTSALLIGAYRFSSSLRVGGYLDQNLSQSTPGGVAQLGNATPMVGVFGVWSQNPDGTGVEAKVSAGYATKGATLTRPVVGVSEAGSGSTNLTAQGVQAQLKYGFAVGNKSVVSPYAGMRYMVGGMGGYSEAQSSTVSSPLTYSSISNYTTTALAGLIANHRLSEKVMLVGSAGAEKDVNANVGNLITSGNGDFNIAMNNNYRSLRPTASLAAFYDLSAKERLGLTGIYRQESYQAVTSTTVLATYTVGL